MTWALNDAIETAGALEMVPGLRVLHPPPSDYDEVHDVTDKARFDDFVASNMDLSGRRRSRVGIQSEICRAVPASISSTMK